eukprot:9032210-Pyramimonas_sp.AAC.1
MGAPAAQAGLLSLRGAKEGLARAAAEQTQAAALAVHSEIFDHRAGSSAEWHVAREWLVGRGRRRQRR